MQNKLLTLISCLFFIVIQCFAQHAVPVDKTLDPQLEKEIDSAYYLMHRYQIEPNLEVILADFTYLKKLYLKYNQSTSIKKLYFAYCIQEFLIKIHVDIISRTGLCAKDALFFHNNHVYNILNCKFYESMSKENEAILNKIHEQVYINKQERMNLYKTAAKMIDLDISNTKDLKDYITPSYLMEILTKNRTTFDPIEFNHKLITPVYVILLNYSKFENYIQTYDSIQTIKFDSQEFSNFNFVKYKKMEDEYSFLNPNLYFNTYFIKPSDELKFYLQSSSDTLKVILADRYRSSISEGKMEYWFCDLYWPCQENTTKKNLDKYKKDYNELRTLFMENETKKNLIAQKNDSIAKTISEPLLKSKQELKRKESLPHGAEMTYDEIIQDINKAKQITLDNGWEFKLDLEKKYLSIYPELNQEKYLKYLKIVDHKK